MTDYLCLTLLARAEESEAAFKSRLTSFWTHLLRNRPDDYAKVYAEATHFGSTEGKLSRQYLVEADAIDVLTDDLTTSDVDFLPVDADDMYTKYEAAPPDWFWIEH